MNCNWFEERFERFLDGQLNAGDRARLSAHVDACASCGPLFEELRVVDALLLTPRAIDLPPNFTFATMAEVNAMPAPQVRRPPVLAATVAYVVAAWSLIGALFLINANAAFAMGETALDVAHGVLAAFGGLGHVAARLSNRGDFTWPTLAGGVVLADGLVVVALALAVRYLQPRLAERLRG